MGYAVTKKGQVTIPKHVRERLGIAPGDEVDFANNDRGKVVVRAAVSEPDRWFQALREAQAKFKLSMSADELLAITRGTDREGRDLD
jgi:antitoxin PrlF